MKKPSVHPYTLTSAFCGKGVHTEVRGQPWVPWLEVYCVNCFVVVVLFKASLAGQQCPPPLSASPAL